jgi:hypothetical protein
MDPTATLIFGVLGGLIKAAPDALDTIERWVAGERAKRVEEIRPATSHTDAAIARLKGADPSPAAGVPAAMLRTLGPAAAGSIEEAATIAAVDADIRRRVIERLKTTLSAEELAAFRPVT